MLSSSGERDGVKRDRRQTLGSDSSRKGPALQGAGGEEHGQGRKLPGHRLQLNSETHFPLFLIKQLIFNYKSEAGSPHEMSYVIYQKQSSLGRCGPWPRFKPGSGSGVSPQALVHLGQCLCVITQPSPRETFLPARI